MKLPVAPAQYDKRDQDLTRGAIERNDYEVVHFGRDIPLARGEKLILYSADGSQFAVTVDDNGTLATTPVSGAVDLNPRGLVFTPGGDGAVSFYRIDATHAQNPRTALIGSIAGDIITLTTATAAEFFTQTFMSGVSYIRIWNTTKNPDEQAWVKAQPANNQLTVVSAAAIAGWSNGDTIQVGDPLAETPGRVMAIDISPMMQAILGSVFRQSGIIFKCLTTNIGAAGATIDLSPDGTAGSFSGAKANAFNGESLLGQFTIPCSMLSPVSESNLVFLRETVTGANMGISLASAIGVWI